MLYSQPNPLSIIISLLFLGVTLTAQTGLHKRQDLSGLPTCSQPCLLTALGTSNGGCSQTDFACLCKSQTFLDASSKCYQSACSSNDAQAATSWGLKTCASIGVNINVPTNTTSNNSTTTPTTSNNSTTTSNTTTTTPASTSAKSSASQSTIPLFTLAITILIGSLFT